MVQTEVTIMSRVTSVTWCFRFIKSWSRRNTQDLFLRKPHVSAKLTNNGANLTVLGIKQLTSICAKNKWIFK